MNLMNNDPFEESLGEFLNGRLKEAKWELDETPNTPITYGAEVSIPVVMHYTNLMQAESMMLLFKEFFKEFYDKLEVAAMEMMAGKNFTISESWAQAPDRMSQLILTMMTDPFYIPYLNEQYPTQEQAFGEKIISVWGRAAIYEKLSGQYVMMFAGSTNAMLQSKEDIFKYNNGKHFTTIY